MIQEQLNHLVKVKFFSSLKLMQLLFLKTCTSPSYKSFW